MTGSLNPGVPSADLRSLRDNILAAISDGDWFSTIACRFSVTTKLVGMLAYDPDSSAICARCSGAGQTSRDNPRKATTCSACGGQGCNPQ